MKWEDFPGCPVPVHLDSRTLFDTEEDYTAIYDWLRQHARQMLVARALGFLSVHDEEDAIQDVALKIFVQCRSMTLQNPAAFVSKLLRDAAVDIRRRNARYKLTDSFHALLSAEPDPDEPTIEDLKAYIETLDGRNRELLAFLVELLQRPTLASLKEIRQEARERFKQSSGAFRVTMSRMKADASAFLNQVPPPMHTVPDVLGRERIPARARTWQEQVPHWLVCGYRNALADEVALFEELANA